MDGALLAFDGLGVLELVALGGFLTLTARALRSPGHPLSGRWAARLCLASLIASLAIPLIYLALGTISFSHLTSQGF